MKHHDEQQHERQHEQQHEQQHERQHDLPHDLQRLTSLYADGQASDTQIRQLDEMLRAGADARRQFVEIMNLDAAIATCAVKWQLDTSESLENATDISDTCVDVHQSCAKTDRTWHLRGLAAAACVAMLISAVFWWRGAGEPFATVVSEVGIEAITTGQLLHDEPYEIKTGTVEFITARGAQVVIEAPAKFQFESAQRLRLAWGRVAADVPPPAKGFTVVTPTGQAVDLGTKFGVDVPRAGEAEVHVFEGRVIAQPAGGQRHDLRDGEAVQLHGRADAARELRSSAFIRPEEVASLNAGLLAGQRERSDAALDRLRQDPALIALLDFESGELPEGTYQIVQGRWPGTRAPEFVNIGDHMALDIGGDREWPELTLAAWVRLDQLGAPYQSLLHTDGWSQNNPGQAHWMVTRHTTMRLALYGNTLAPGSDEKDGFPDSQTSVLPEQHRWAHLATVYDAGKRTVRFYLNGEFDKETRQEIAHPARLGPAQMGNWDRQDRKLSGRVDDMVILGRAMDDAQVRALFESGNPYR